jgi:hypothetical protein
VTSPDVASYAAMRHTGSITCAFANTPPASLGQLECGRMNRTLARAVRGVAHGAAGAYVGAVLFLVTVGIIDSFVHPQGTEMLWTRESLSALFLLSFGGDHCPWLVDRSPRCLLRSLLFSKTVRMAPKSSHSQGRPARGRTRAAHSSILRSGLSA